MMHLARLISTACLTGLTAAIRPCGGGLPASLTAAYRTSPPLRGADCVRLAHDDMQAVNLEFNLQNLTARTVEDGLQSVTLYEIPGEGITYQDGKPVLPAVSRFVVVPPDAGLQLVVTADEPRVIPAEHPPLLCDDRELAASNKGRYGSERDGHDSDLYPAVYAEMSAPVNIRGARVVQVTTYPIQYDRVNNCYLERDRISAEVRYTGDAPVNPVAYPIRRHRSAAFKNFIGGLAVNGADVGRDDPDYSEPPAYLGHYLIVSHQDCLEYASPFIEWRRKQGYKVDIFRVPSNRAADGNEDWIKDSIEVFYENYLEAGEDPFDEILLIGDQSEISPGTNWILGSFYNIGGDWDYACLEGNDEDADVGFARWCSGSEDLMGLFVNRTLSYEVTPYMEDPAWFTRGAVFSQKWGGNWHISLHTNVRWGVEVLQSLGFTDVRFQESFDDDGGYTVGSFIIDQFNDGVNLLAGRAQAYYLAGNFPDDHARVFPIYINFAGHGEYACWAMLRSGSADNLKGAVAATTGSGASATLPYSVCWLETVNGFLQRDLTYGWTRLQATIAPRIYFPNFYYCQDDVAFYGDPGLQYWRGVPQIVTAESPESVPEDVKLIEVRVLDEDGEEPVAGANVTLYAPGDMPDPDQEDYATYADMRVVMHQSDADGWARFVFDQPFEDDDQIFLTVSGRDILPLLDTINVEQPDLAVNLDGWRLEEIQGNGDDNTNPSESFDLYITAANLSADQTASDVTATVASESGWVVVSSDTITFGDIAENSSLEAEEPIEISLAPSCPDGMSRPSTRPLLIVQFASGEGTWRSAIQLNPAAPNLEVKQVVNGIIVVVRNRSLNIRVKNVGSIASDDVAVEIVPLSAGMISIVRGSSRYDGIASGRDDVLDGDQFTVAGLSITVPGTLVPMALVFYDGQEVVDSALFQLQVRQPAEETPQGPDPYGYICFDDTDTDWDIAPDYDWIEISTREQDRDFDGTRLGFRGNSPENIGEAIVIPLPFTNQFYGQIYDTITVGTNGFIAFGKQPKIVNFQNWPMDRCIGGGVGMLAPFWDDLRLQRDESDVSYYYDEDDNRFIVEWYKMALASGGDYRQTFEVILYDHDIWITETGDQNILFQYKAITDDEENIRGDSQAWYDEVPYSSVGISSPDGNAGISYFFNNDYPVTSARLQAQRALLFSTRPKYKQAVLWGRVTDYDTGLPIAGASLVTQHNFIAATDDDGYWEMTRVLAEVEFYITASKQGYNDSTLSNLEAAEDDTMEINFALLHPEFVPSTRMLYAMVDSSRSAELSYNIQNDGNGPLDWTMQRKLPRGADVTSWTLRLSYNFGQQVRDNRIEGVVYANGKFFVAGGDPEDNEQNWIYIFNRDGELLDLFEQPGQSRFGFGDMDWDGELLWGSGERNVYGITTEGDVVSTFEGPDRNIQAIAWDPDRELLWICSITANEIIGCNQNGNPLDEVANPGFRIRGLAYWIEDPDHPLYIIHSPDNERQIVHKMNPDTGDTVFVVELQPERGGSPGGAYITNQYDVYSWVFASVANDADRDRVDIWQLDARRDWFVASMETPQGWLPANSGWLDAGDTQNFKLLLNTADLIKALFVGYLVYEHNAAGGVDTISVGLDVIGPTPPMAFNLISPADGDTIFAWSETDFTWERSVDPNFGEQVSYRVWFQAGMDSVMRETADTVLAADIGTLGLNLANDAPVMWWVQALSGSDEVECRERFALRYFINDLPVDGEPPVEFGIRSVYPTPFNSQTAVRFGADRTERLTIKSYDIQGRLVATLYDQTPRVGNHQIVWNASALPAGVYILRLQSGSRVQTAKVAIIR
jgi:hypothetical protein